MASAAQRRIKSISYAKYGYFFIAPFFLVYAFFQIWPLINTFILSVYGNGSEGDTFVGLQNFQTLLFGGDDRSARRIHAEFVRDFGNTLILWIGNFIPQILLSLLLAVWFTDSKLHIPGQGFFKVVMYLPNIITAVSVAALFMRFFSNSNMCLVNGLLTSAGKDAFMFEDNAAWSRAIVMFIQTWLWFGNTMIMMMSGILGINPSLFEAAAIDGATSGQVLRKVTLPLLRPMVVYTLITSMIGGLQMFDIPNLLVKNGGPNEIAKTVVMDISNGISGSADVGFAATESVVLFFVAGIIGIFLFKLMESDDDKEARANKKAQKKALKNAKKVQKCWQK